MSLFNAVLLSLSLSMLLIYWPLGFEIDYCAIWANYQENEFDPQPKYIILFMIVICYVNSITISHNVFYKSP